MGPRNQALPPKLSVLEEGENFLAGRGPAPGGRRPGSLGKWRPACPCEGGVGTCLSERLRKGFHPSPGCGILGQGRSRGLLSAYCIPITELGDTGPSHCIRKGSHRMCHCSATRSDTVRSGDLVPHQHGELGTLRHSAGPSMPAASYKGLESSPIMTRRKPSSL